MTALNTPKLNIAVIMGGTSAEREVSLRSGSAIMKALLEQNINATAIDGLNNLQAASLQEYDAIFNILHGEAGENGELAGLLSAFNVKYTGCDVAGAVRSWNKVIAKTIVAAHGLTTPQSQTLSHISDLKVSESDSGPWIVKPTKEGSSVGLYYAQDINQLKSAVEKALQSVDSILVEKFIDGTECTVAIVKDNILPVIRIKPKVGLYDYDAKYENIGTQYFCPSGFDDELEEALKRDALTAFKALGLKGWARIDFIIDSNKKRWFLEANTTPGMTKTSLVPKAAKVIGWSFNELVRQILSTAFVNDMQDNNDGAQHV